MASNCALCSKFVSIASEPTCSGPCRRKAHAVCLSKMLNIPIEAGKLVTSFRCMRCQRDASVTGATVSNKNTGGVDDMETDEDERFLEASPSMLVKISPTTETTNIRESLAAVEGHTSSLPAFIASQSATNDLLCRKLDSLTEANDRLMTLFNAVTDKLNSLTAADAELANRCDRLQQENVSLRERLASATARLDYVESQMCGAELLISGVPERDGEDLRAVVTSIVAAIGHTLVGTDIIAASRVGRARDEENSRAVSVKLINNMMRNKLWQLKRRKGVLLVGDVPCLTFSAGQKRIYINESLPPATRRLYAEVRCLVAAKGWTRTWVRNGLVYLLRDVNAKPLRIHDVSDLSALDSTA